MHKGQKMPKKQFLELEAPSFQNGFGKGRGQEMPKKHFLEHFTSLTNRFLGKSLMTNFKLSHGGF
jgi:hypothetical protein